MPVRKVLALVESHGVGRGKVGAIHTRRNARRRTAEGDMMLTIRLPWPDPALFPNRRTHWHKLYELRTEAKRTAYMLTYEAMQGKSMSMGSGKAPIEYEFCYPDNRKRDNDGMLGALKAAQDGIADALGIDDTRFEPVTLRRGENVGGGAVIVRIGGN